MSVLGGLALAAAAVGVLNPLEVGGSARTVASESETVSYRAEDSSELRSRASSVSRSYSRRQSPPDVDEAEQLAAKRGRTLAQVSRSAASYSRRLERDQWVLPVTEYRLTGRFGNVSSLWSTSHTGLDFAAPLGTPIRSIAKGVVTESGWAGAYGLRTVVTLENGTELWYCHQNSAAVSVGDTIDAGEVIGEVGATGNVTGPHLHLEVRPGGGDPVDPLAALAERGIRP